MKSSLITSALILLAAVPAAAQNGSFARRQFTFLDNDITIEVLADMPGTLQVVRGEEGVIDVSARVPGGMPAFALGGHGEKLRLTAAGGSHANFIVVVPEHVYLRVRLPNHKSGDLGSSRPGGTFTWGDDSNANATPQGASNALPEPPAPVVAHSAEHAPRVLSIPRLTVVRTVAVRLQSSLFQVGGSRYMSVLNGSGDNVEIRTGTQPEELFVTIPAETRDFTLKLAGHTALVIRDAEVTTYCEPVTEQSLGPGERWFTFAPEAGILRCH